MSEKASSAGRKAKGPFKYHVVFIGRQIGIFDNWGMAKSSVDRYPHSNNKGYQDLRLAVSHMAATGIRDPHLFGECPTEISSVKIGDNHYVLNTNDIMSSMPRPHTTSVGVPGQNQNHQSSYEPNKSDSLEDLNLEDLMNVSYNQISDETLSKSVKSSQSVNQTRINEISSGIPVTSKSYSHVNNPISESEEICVRHQIKQHDNSNECLNTNNSFQCFESEKADCEIFFKDREYSTPSSTNLQRKNEASFFIEKHDTETQTHCDHKDFYDHIIASQNEILQQNMKQHIELKNDLDIIIANMRSIHTENQFLSESVSQLQNKLSQMQERECDLEKKLDTIIDENTCWHKKYNDLEDKLNHQTYVQRELMNTLRLKEVVTDSKTLNSSSSTRKLDTRKPSCDINSNDKKISLESVTPQVSTVKNLAEHPVMSEDIDNPPSQDIPYSQSSGISLNHVHNPYHKSNYQSDRRKQREDEYVEKNSLGFSQSCTHVLLGDSNLKNIQRKRLDRTGKTEIRTYRGASIRTLTGIVKKNTITYPNVIKTTFCIGTNDCARQDIDSIYIIDAIDQLILAAKVIFPNALISILAIPPQRNPEANLCIQYINRNLKKSVHKNQAVFKRCDSLWDHVDSHGVVDGGILVDNVHLSQYGLSLLLQQIISFFYKDYGKVTLRNFIDRDQQVSSPITTSIQKSPEKGSSELNTSNQSKLVSKIKSTCLKLWKQYTEN